MSKNALKYVVSVSEDPALAESHKNDPDAAMDVRGFQMKTRTF